MSKSYFSEKLGKRFTFPDDASLADMQSAISEAEGTSPSSSDSIGQYALSAGLAPVRDVAASLGGAPADITNLGLRLGEWAKEKAGYPGDTPYQIPFGSESVANWINKQAQERLGYQPPQPGSWRSAMENIEGLTASSVAPGGIARKGAEYLPFLEKVVPWLSFGRNKDILSGTLSGIGASAGEVLDPSNPQRGKTIGAVTGGSIVPVSNIGARLLFGKSPLHLTPGEGELAKDMSPTRSQVTGNPLMAAMEQLQERAPFTRSATLQKTKEQVEKIGTQAEGLASRFGAGTQGRELSDTGTALRSQMVTADKDLHALAKQKFEDAITAAAGHEEEASALEKAAENILGKEWGFGRIKSKAGILLTPRDPNTFPTVGKFLHDAKFKQGQSITDPITKQAVFYPATYNLDELITLRSRLGEAMADTKYTNRMLSSQYRQLWNATKDDIDKFRKLGSHVADPLDEGYRIYRDEYAPTFLENPVVRQIVKDDKLSPDKVLGKIIPAPGKTGGDLATLKTVKKAIGPAGWNEISTAWVDNFMREFSAAAEKNPRQAIDALVTQYHKFRPAVRDELLGPHRQTMDDFISVLTKYYQSGTRSGSHLLTGGTAAGAFILGYGAKKAYDHLKEGDFSGLLNLAAEGAAAAITPKMFLRMAHNPNVMKLVTEAAKAPPTSRKAVAAISQLTRLGFYPGGPMDQPTSHEEQTLSAEIPMRPPSTAPTPVASPVEDATARWLRERGIGRK